MFIMQEMKGERSVRQALKDFENAPCHGSPENQEHKHEKKAYIYISATIHNEAVRHEANSCIAHERKKKIKEKEKRI